MVDAGEAMDMLEPSLNADEAMDMLERSLTADEAVMDVLERFLMTFTVDDNGVAQSADGSLIWPLMLLYISGLQHSLEEELEEEDEAAEFFDRTSSHDGGQDGDDGDGDGEEDVVVYQFDHPTEETVQQAGRQQRTVMIILNLLAQQQEIDFETVLHYFVTLIYGEGAYDADGARRPASDVAVAGLEKQSFHDGRGGGVTGCAICLEDFDDGEEVTVMPCSRDHEYHPDCITKWLGKNNTCPLCRHALPTDDVDAGP